MSRIALKPIRKGRPVLERLWIAFAVLVTLSLGFYGWMERAITGVPPMVVDFAKEHPSAVSMPFDAVLARKFPIDSPDSNLRSELRRAGNSVTCWTALPRPGKLVPTCIGYAGWFVQGCLGHINVDWQADDHGRLTALHGQYSQRCGVNAAGR